MRSLFYAVAVALSILLVACGGGGGGSAKTGLEIPVVSVSGIAFDGLISGGSVNIYDFTAGTKGTLLATATTNTLGLYSTSIQIESRPLLIEVTGGTYIEEATNLQVTLSTDINKPIDKLTALVNYTQGTPLSVSVTTFTHIAAGLAANLIKNGSVAATAVDSANQRISNLAGINILTTTPLQIIDPANANITLTPELKYGFLAGAISLWVKNNAPQYTSIAFAQLAYRDIATDGLLNGMGVDSVNSPIPLGLGTTPVTLNDYRYGIALNLVKMAHDQNNKTGITANSILSYAQLIATNTDLIFNNAATQTLSAPKVSITSYASNAFIRKTINLTGNISDDIGITSSELFIDGVSKGVILNASTPSFAIDTKLYSDGSHNIGIKTTNWGGLTTTTTIPLRVDNTPPTSTGSYYDSLAPWVRHVSGVVTDVAPVTIMVIGNTSATQGNQYFNNVNGTTPDSFGNWQLNITDLNINWPIVLFKDIVGNCATYAVDNNSGAWILISSGTC